MSRVIVTLLFLTLACRMPPHPEFRPASVDNDEAVRVWLANGPPIILTHSYEEDLVDVSIEISRADSVHIACSVWVENRSQHDTVIHFGNTTIEDDEGFLWTLSGAAFSVEDNDWSEEWRIGPGEAGTFNAIYESQESAERSPTAFAVRLSGFIGPFELIDIFSFTRIDWP